MIGLFLTNDLLFSSQVTGAAQAQSAVLEICMSPARLLERVGVGDVALVLLDLTFPGLDVAGLVKSLRATAPAAHLVAYGPHVQLDVLNAAVAAGCQQVMARGQFHVEYAQLLRRHLTAAPGP